MSHYFDPQPRVPSRPAAVELVLPDLHLRLVTDRGVFSSAGVDPGTRYLLLHGPPAPGDARHLLDLGCGYGPIALTLAHRAPEATVWAVDVNERARELCAQNAATAGFTNVRVAAPADVPQDVRFDAVWSNPPIRIGKPALRALLSDWLPRLVPIGHAHLVVHKNLGSDSLARWLQHEGWAVTRLGSWRGYRILDVASTTS